MGEKTKGHKRYIVTDTMGNLLAVVVHVADIHDTKAGILVAKPAYERYPSIQRFCADAGYRKTFEKESLSYWGLVLIFRNVSLPNGKHCPNAG